MNVSIIKSFTQVPWNHSSEVCEIEPMDGWHVDHQTHSSAFLDLSVPFRMELFQDGWLAVVLVGLIL